MRRSSFWDAFAVGWIACGVTCVGVSCCSSGEVKDGLLLKRVDDVGAAAVAGAPDKASADAMREQVAALHSDVAARLK